MEVLADDPPEASERPGDPPGDKPSKPDMSLRIRDAAAGETVTITGTVTAPAGLIDGDGRRVTVQDRSGRLVFG